MLNKLTSGKHPFSFMELYQCKSTQDSELLVCLNQVTESMNVHNIFNPSFYITADVKIMAFRAIPIGSKILTSYVSIEQNGSRKIHDITSEYEEQFGEKRLIDPKVFKLHDGIYITFNTGLTPGGNNIYVMKIYPKLGLPKRIKYANRQDQERNWAFFSENDEVYALYTIEPLRILKLRKRDSNSWEFEDHYGTKPTNGIQNTFTIGTQLFKAKGEYFFVAHRKLSIFKKKFYVGKLCMFDFHQREIRKGKCWLVHSLRSLLGCLPKHNTNLLSCTYFSGLQINKNRLLLGYGVNDVKACFSSHKLTEFFPKV